MITLQVPIEAIVVGLVGFIGAACTCIFFVARLFVRQGEQKVLLRVLEEALDDFEGRYGTFAGSTRDQLREFASQGVSTHKDLVNMRARIEVLERLERARIRRRK